MTENKGSIKFYCHKCSKQVENVIYSQDDSTDPPSLIWLCDKCNNLKQFTAKHSTYKPF